jgi:hypothetical protein
LSRGPGGSRLEDQTANLTRVEGDGHSKVRGVTVLYPGETLVIRFAYDVHG